MTRGGDLKISSDHSHRGSGAARRARLARAGLTHAPPGALRVLGRPQTAGRLRHRGGSELGTHTLPVRHSPPRARRSITPARRPRQGSDDRGSIAVAASLRPPRRFPPVPTQTGPGPTARARDLAC